ncbi:DUF4185 domain-containing protein [Mycolicibacterium arseniciresistens]|uniref:DUF4185 domain-containing protein n=1 Tax=Mycolicibacterium arseniciresistens TaxID=3062257 RepID=A0ABT8UFV8_9MYCO|nr:DUF4185 domain-containing protein [Mycolicibacterium arseniciresistens]MDO3636669.1 DUF4185 domain-containing protein [Mycolicibacterium arseniciresistens]
MGASAYVGRVGGLAVALGVGIAVVSGGAGVALAEETSTSDNTSQDSSTDTTKDAAKDESADDSTPADDKTPEPVVKKKKSPSWQSRLEKRLERLKTAGADARSRWNVGGETSVEDGVKTDAGGPDATEAAGVGTGGPTQPAVVKGEVKAPLALSSSSARSRASARDDRITRIEVQAARPRVTTRAVVVDKTPTGPQPETKTLAAVTETRSITTAVTTAVSSVTAAGGQVASALAAAPTAVPAPAPATRIVNRVLAALGLGTLSNVPVAPTSPWALGALMAVAARRETEQVASTAAVSTTARAAVTTAATTTAALVATPDPATDYQVTPVPVSGNTDYITAVTGRNSLNQTFDRFGIGGTDVGVMWDNGIRDNPLTPVNEHQVLIAFGDTFFGDNPVRQTGWRMNTLFRSYDSTLSNGMYVRDGIIHDPGTYSGSPMSVNNYSREIIGKYGYAVGPEVTIIPTAAISVPGAGVNGATRQYINFMSVRSWDTPGRWTTNYSAIAYSDDNGQNWRTVPASSVRPAAVGRSTRPFISGNQNFQQFAYVKGAVVDATGAPVTDPVTGEPKTDGYVYAFGTPAGRGGTAYLSRVNEREILDQTKYQYWNGSTWVNNNPAAAKPILPGTTTTSWFGLVKNTTYPTVGEMSVQYNAYEKKYVMLYADQNNNVVIRKADRPEGPWTAPTTLVTSSKMPGLYAPMIHPWSSTANVSSSDQQYLYWNISTWDDYQVKTMRTDLSKV